MFQSARYKTPGIDEAIPPELQLVLWSLIDARVKQKARMDYLQVFELSSRHESSVQVIVHRQEQPPYRNEWEIKCSSPVHGVIVWVIDAGEYATMLLPNEY